MNNQLSKIEATTVAETTALGKLFAESGFFTDTKTAAQAAVKIMAGQELGLPPFASMSGIHLVQGRPMIGGGLMAATLKGSGKYDYRVLKLDDTVCSIDFLQGKENLGNSTFTIADAKKAGTKNIDKFPKNMLFARAISNGVKWFCPDIFSGPVYVTGEIDEPEVEVITPHVEVIPEHKICNAKQFEKIKAKIEAGEENIMKSIADSNLLLTKEQQEELSAIIPVLV